MKLLATLFLLTLGGFQAAAGPTGRPKNEKTLDGVRGLANRLFENQGDRFDFVLRNSSEGHYSRWNTPGKDNYTVSSGSHGKIVVEGSSLSALCRGLRHYANDMLHLDESWFVDAYYPDGKTLPKLPVPTKELQGESIVPWRYNFNTVTFSYSFVWYSWADWEKLLDWAALRGVNVQLAWVGYEKIFLESFRSLGLKDSEIMPFFSSTAFQSWNRFGNIHGTWKPESPLSMAWIDKQFELQKKIVARMVELGITPILPAFPGFVPDALPRIRPNADIVKTPNWSGFPASTSHVSFLSPLDKTTAELQKLFVEKQIEAYGNISSVYTLDQFNEIKPSSGESSYLTSVSSATYKALTAANPAAIWLLQGWLFYSDKTFWSQDRVEAYLKGPDKSSNSMLILDLFSESNPQWQRTKSYAGRPWIWCELHGFGGNMALEGQITNVTVNPIQALHASDSSMVGMGLTPEGYEGNQVMYDLLLDQAWSTKAIETKSYFHDWITTRYASHSSSSQSASLPANLYEAWELLRQHVYDNKNPGIPQVPVAIYQLAPAIKGLYDRKGHSPHPTAHFYDNKILKHAWSLMFSAAESSVSSKGAHSLWNVPAFQLDFVDVTRQVISNVWDDLYQDLVQTYNKKQSASSIKTKGSKMLSLLSTLDSTLDAHEHFTLCKWLKDAKAWADLIGDDTSNNGAKSTLAFDARTQVTVWGLQSNLNDYAAKAWSGLTSGYFKERWRIFIDALVDAAGHGYNLDVTKMNGKIRGVEKDWQFKGWDTVQAGKCRRAWAQDVAKTLKKDWPDIFS